MLFKRARAATAVTMAALSLGSVSYWSGTSGAATTNEAPRLEVLVHLQDIGDVTYQANQFAGTRGESRQLEGFQVRLNPKVPGVSLRYMAHVASHGDTPFVSEGQYVGTRGEGLPVEGFAMRLAGSSASKYSVKYMAHVEGIGDTAVCADGAFCGTRGEGRAIEGMMVRIELRGTTTNTTVAPVTTTTTVAPAPTTAPTTTTTTRPPVPAPAPVGTSTGAEVVLRPSVIPLSDPEIANPLRGQYEWNNSPALPSWWPHQESYDRFGWYELEPSQGTYDFSRIDRMLERAASMIPPRRHSFGIMTAMSCCNWGQADWNGGVQVPGYMVRGDAGGWYSHDGATTWWPNPNSEIYLNRWEALMRALGDRYRNDKRMAYMDIRGFGNFGEFVAPPHTPQVSNASAERLVDAAVNSFSEGGVLKKHLVMMVAHDHALRYAVSRSPKVGVRADCLGSEYGPGVGNASDPSHPARQQWQTAPFVTEWCGNGGWDAMVSASNQALRDVPGYHIASISSGNIDSVGDPPYSAYATATKSSGYRFHVNEAALPGVLTPGTSFRVATKWSNVGVTPAYDDWNVTLQLRNPSTESVVFDGRSDLNLRTLLPTGGTPRSVNDSFVLPATVAPGTYDVVVRVVDAGGYLPPLNIANSDKTGDGSYRLGSVKVG